MANPDEPGPRRHRGTRAILKMVEFAPSTGGLALWIRHQDVADPTAPRLIANNGATIYYGPRFADLPLPEQIGLVAHQVLHVALRHPQRLRDLQHRLGDVDQELFNLCADAIINSTLGHLSWLKLPATAVHLEQLLANVLDIREDPEKSLLEWDLERLYRAIDDRHPPRSTHLLGHSSRHQDNGEGAHREAAATGSGQRQDGPRPGPRDDGPRSARVRRLGYSVERDLLPADNNQDAADEAEQSRDWSQRLLRAHVSDGEHSMLRGLIADRPRIHTPWEQILRTRLTRGLSRRVALTWSRPARSYLANRGRLGNGKRMPWEPGMTSAQAVPRLVVIVDVSGSIEAPLLNRFAQEIEAITRRLETRITVIVGDCQVSRVATFEPGRSNLREIQFQGGGGTDFTPLLKEADIYGPDLGVVLTDLQGPANYRPAWPVLWAVPAASQTRVPPFGSILVLR